MQFHVFEPSDLEEKSVFETTFTIDNIEQAKAICRLYKIIKEKLHMYCKFNTIFNHGLHKFNVSSSSFNYKNKTVLITSQIENLKFYQLNTTIPFLYSGRQVLNIDEKTEIYEIKYKIVEYHNETLFIPQNSDNIILDKCSIKGKELICKINRIEIEELNLPSNMFDVFFYNFNDTEEMEPVADILDRGIYINYYLNKTNIYVKITNLLQSDLGKQDYLTYGTNVTDITNVNSDEFEIKLSNEKTIRCSLKKSVKTSLLMNCGTFSIDEEIFYLGEIKELIVLEDINIKYNFFILPVINEEKCAISGNGSYTQLTFPRTLDFTLKDSFITDIFIYPRENARGLKFNPDAKELECIGIDSRHFIRCTVHKSHFQNKISDYYFTYHQNYLNKSIIYYESSPIKVILPKEIVISISAVNNQKKIIFGNNGGVFALVSNYNDKENNIFNNNENINFDIKLIDINDPYVQFNIGCRLWKPNDDYMRIICDLSEGLINSTRMLILNKTSFTYKDYKIIVEQDQALQYQGYNCIIPFLYSDKQIITMFFLHKL